MTLCVQDLVWIGGTYRRGAAGVQDVHSQETDHFIHYKTNVGTVGYIFHGICPLNTHIKPP